MRGGGDFGRKDEIQVREGKFHSVKGGNGRMLPSWFVFCGGKAISNPKGRHPIMGFERKV